MGTKNATAMLYSQQGWEENSVLSFASKELWADPALQRLGALKGPSVWDTNERRLPHALLITRQKCSKRRSAPQKDNATDSPRLAQGQVPGTGVFALQR